MTLIIEPIVDFTEDQSRRILRQQQSRCARDIAMRLIADQSVTLCHAENGQPVFCSSADQAVPALSLSHSREWVMAGINHEGLIGVDIEAVRPFPNALEIARSRFSPAEAARVQEDPNVFWGIWVIREAIAKMDGKGLSGAFAVEAALVLDVLDKGDCVQDGGRTQVSFRATEFYHCAVSTLFKTGDLRVQTTMKGDQPFRLAGVVNSLHPPE